jgi:hypothetical protein
MNTITQKFKKEDLKKQILKNINLASDIHKHHKNNILSQLIDANIDLAPQGSPEWLAIRETSIGGSEMSVITGDNPFQKIDTLISQKLGFSKFNGNIACRWGKMFEIMTQKITEYIFDIEYMYETGSLEGAVPHQRYSPDGLGIVKIKCEDTYDDEMIETEEQCIVLFEYKSPYSSIPHGFIPKHYLPQVKTGLCSIPIADFAIFINNMYRKCSMDNLNEFLEYDTDFHSRDKKFIAENVLALGVNIFYQTKEQQQEFIKLYSEETKEIDDSLDLEPSDSDEESGSDSEINVFDKIGSYQKPIVYNDNPPIYRYISKLINDPTLSIRDFGKSYYSEFNNILELYDKGLVSIHCCEPHVFDEYYNNNFLSSQGKKNKMENDPTKSIETYKKEIAGFKNILGYLPWKMFKSDIIYEDRDPNYMKKYESEINRIIGIINEIKAKSNQADQVVLFKKYFPKSKILKDNGLVQSDAFEFLPRNIN